MFTMIGLMLAIFDLFPQSVADTSIPQNVYNPNIGRPRPVTINPKTGKPESVLANMEAIYPDWPQMNTEMSFEELRAAHRGWLSRDWAAETREMLLAQETVAYETVEDNFVEQQDLVEESLAIELEERLVVEEEYELQFEGRIEKEGSTERRSGRPKKMKVMEVRGEPQTSMKFFEDLEEKC